MLRPTQLRPLAALPTAGCVQGRSTSCHARVREYTTGYQAFDELRADEILAFVSVPVTANDTSPAWSKRPVLCVAEVPGGVGAG